MEKNSDLQYYCNIVLKNVSNLFYVYLRDAILVAALLCAWQLVFGQGRRIRNIYGCFVFYSQKINHLCELILVRLP